MVPSGMEWTPQQEAALRDVSRWLDDPSSKVYRLFGYAGTGKTTLAKTLAEGISSVVFCAFTAKAALVLREKGCLGARTVNSLLYRTMERSPERLEELEEELKLLLTNRGSAAEIREKEDQIRLELCLLNDLEFHINPTEELLNARLVVLDEASMIDEQMGEDLEKVSQKLLVLGDPAQLPPVKGGESYFMRKRPDTLLTDVQRQARDSPVIELATKVRNKERLALGQYGDSSVMDIGRFYGVLKPEMMHADQILCWRNNTRHTINKEYRKKIGRTDPLPMQGDRLVGLQNIPAQGLFNGAIYRTLENARTTVDPSRMRLRVEPELNIDDSPARTHNASTASIMGQDLTKVGAAERKTLGRLRMFNYGYALTVHKAQGSQWNDVYTLDEHEGSDHWRWLYTAITRAAERVVVARAQTGR